MAPDLKVRDCAPRDVTSCNTVCSCCKRLRSRKHGWADLQLTAGAARRPEGLHTSELPGRCRIFAVNCKIASSALLELFCYTPRSTQEVLQSTAIISPR